MAKSTKESAFIKELKDLLAKHNASIDFECSDCSDTMEISEPRMVAYVDSRMPLKLSNGWELEANDLEDK